MRLAYNVIMVKGKSNKDQLTLLKVDSEKICTTKIRLPEIVSERLKVGKNFVVQFVQAEEEIEVDIYPYAKDVLLLKTQDGSRQLYLKLPGARIKTPIGEVLRISDFTTVKEIGPNNKIVRQSSISVTPKKPAAIVKSWRNSFTFAEEIIEEGEMASPGLRKPQLGAIHAVAARWSLSSDSSTVVMPTGTGKTDTMLSVLIHQQCNRLLVLVPSRTLRRQIFNKFVLLGKLREIGVLSDGALNPRVALIEHGITDVVEAKDLAAEANVIIATASVLNKFSDEAKQVLVGECSHLFIDEAHHVPARSWNDVKAMFAGKPVLQFTATPFRRDSKPIEGDIIYNYPLGLAQEEGYFRKINLLQLQEFDETKSDEAIAKAAIAALDIDIEKSLNHMIMARCNDKNRAEEVFRLYALHGKKYKPLLITSDLSAKDYARLEASLKSGESRIVVCVNMLGEGFDLPNLKIAALHDTHKSLAITLQFIGRFTRISKDVGDATVVMNVNDPQVNKDLESLYSDNPDWNLLLKEKSESAIEQEIKNHEFIKEFSGELSKHVSLWNLRPGFSTFLYATKCDDWEPEKFVDAMPDKYKYWHAINKKEAILVAVISKEDEVKWGKYKDIKNHSFELCVAHWSAEHKALFIYCSDYDAINNMAFAKAVCGEDATVKNGSQVFNIFSGVERTLARNLGISTVGNISYTMHFGNDITQGLSKLDKSQGVLNNIFAWGYKDGERVAAGCSERSGKIWARGGGPIFLWKEWCHGIAEKVFDKSIQKNQIIDDFLRPEKLESRYKSIPILAQWSENILQAKEDSVTVVFGDDQYKIYEVDIEIIDHTIDGPITFRVFSEKHESKYQITYAQDKCEYTLISGKEVKIKRGNGQEITLVDYVVRDPVVIFYIDGSFSYNDYYVPTPKLNEFFDKDSLNALDWPTTNIQVESMGKESKADSVQYRVAELMKDDYEVLFNDDASGEAADIIAIRQESADTIKLHLIHCKFSSKSYTGSRVDDFYALCGQAQKSIRWKHNGLDYLVNHMKKRNDTWESSGHSRFLKGGMKELNRLKKFSRYAPNFVFEVSIVQPGLSKVQISDDVTQLLGSTEDYLLKTSNAEFSVYCSL